MQERTSIDAVSSAVSLEPALEEEVGLSNQELTLAPKSAVAARRCRGRMCVETDPRRMGNGPSRVQRIGDDKDSGRTAFPQDRCGECQVFCGRARGRLDRDLLAWDAAGETPLPGCLCLA